MTGEFSSRPLGRYQVLDLLGRGGMGEVYRARDASLGRDLAIKILPPDLTRDRSRVERFMQEARAASALNHPHLISIYEIGTEPVHYIAMELVDGRNLRHVLESGRPELKRTIDWLLQVCDALGAAHAAGVVHRDVKPENIMIGNNGYAKVLDFGVAKLRSTDPDAAAGDATRAALTDAGMMVGTSGYMSPEQARGLAADQRSDVFAFGCVLYECITGAPAFDAPSAVERMNQVITADPPPIAVRAPAAPADLSRVVRKCLAKDPDDRYQTMKELAIDLRDVRRQLESGLTPAPSTSLPATSAARRWRAPLVWAAAAVAVAIVAFVPLGRRPTTTIPEPAAAPRISIERLTTSGNTIDSAISADGAYLAHIEAVGSRQELWIRDLKSGQDRQLVPAGSYAFYGVKMSPDGRDIYYTLRGLGYGAGRLYAISRDGGEPRMILNRIVTPVTFAPGGGQLAFYRDQYPDSDSSALMVASADGTSERILATRQAPEAFTPGFFVAPSWSPDGRTITASARNRRSNTAMLIAFDAASGQARELLTLPNDIAHTQWLPDGSGIVFVRRPFVALGSDNGQLWLKPFPDGAPRPITSDLLDYRQSSVTADGELVAVGQDLQAQLYHVPLDGSPLTRIPSERFDGFQGLAQLRDGSYIATTMVNGRAQVMRLAADGSRRTVLTSARESTLPAVSPDESMIAFMSPSDGKFGIWTMTIDGRDQKLAAEIPSPNWLSFTPDGRYIICTSYGSTGPSTWRIPVDGGQPLEIARQFDRAAVSPDGKWLGGVYSASVNASSMTPMISIVPMDGSSPLRSLFAMPTASGTGLLTWARDSSGIIASSNERFNLFFFSLAGGPPKRLTDLGNQDEVFIRGALSADGKSIVAARGRILRDTYKIRDFK
ncbi:MAG TPA: protein kinase [Vicinamibacterales bacterium]|nr:protein kinase [Vicinamibacterales bacterium]